MANWDAAASKGMRDLKASTNATDGDIANLKTAIENWQANNPAATSHSFPFAPLRMRNHAVTATFGGGWITDISYGDN